MKMNSETLSEIMCIGIYFPRFNPKIALTRWLEAGFAKRHLKGHKTTYISRIDKRK